MRRHDSLVAVGLVLAGVALSAPAWAGGEDRLGTAGAEELRVGVGSRGAGLSGAHISTTSGAEALYWNPAGIATVQSTDMLVTHSEYLAGLNTEFAGIATPAMGGVLGASFKALSLGDVIVTTEDAPNGTGEITAPTFTVATLAYARQMTDRVRFGGSMSVVSEHVLQASATGLSADFGFQYDPQLTGLHFGFAMKNFGASMRFTGSSFEQVVTVGNGNPQTKPTIVRTESAAFELPSNVQFGASKSWPVGPSGSFDLMGVFQNNNFSSDEWRFGAEYSMSNTLSLRGGYVASSQSDYIYDWSFGAGLAVPIGSDAKAHVDYGYGNVSDFFDPMHTFSVQVAF